MRPAVGVEELTYKIRLVAAVLSETATCYDDGLLAVLVGFTSVKKAVCGWAVHLSVKRNFLKPRKNEAAAQFAWVATNASEGESGCGRLCWKHVFLRAERRIRCAKADDELFMALSRAVKTVMAFSGFLIASGFKE